MHPPGDDPNQYESSSERWSPVQSVEKILLSVVSMLAGNAGGNFVDSFVILRPIVEPNDESGANIDACKVWRTDREQYNKIVKDCVAKSLGFQK